jgi:hypothetical protein
VKQAYLFFIFILVVVNQTKCQTKQPMTCIDFKSFFDKEFQNFKKITLDSNIEIQKSQNFQNKQFFGINKTVSQSYKPKMVQLD